jgi:hypothetical protein
VDFSPFAIVGGSPWKKAPVPARGDRWGKGKEEGGHQARMGQLCAGGNSRGGFRARIKPVQTRHTLLRAHFETHRSEASVAAITDKAGVPLGGGVVRGGGQRVCDPRRWGTLEGAAIAATAATSDRIGPLWATMATIGDAAVRGRRQIRSALREAPRGGSSGRQASSRRARTGDPAGPKKKPPPHYASPPGLGPRPSARRTPLGTWPSGSPAASPSGGCGGPRLPAAPLRPAPRGAPRTAPSPPAPLSSVVHPPQERILSAW